MKAIIIEDEKLSADHLKRLLSKVDSTIEIIAVYDSVKTAIKAFKANPKIDVLFLDVHLADGISFEIFSEVQLECPIIFTTAYDEYAIKAFKLNSIDYLLKPIGRDDLQVAIAKLKKQSDLKQNQIIENIAHVYHNMHKQYKHRFMVKMGEHIVSVKSDDILHFISEDGLTLLVNNLEKRYPVDYTLEQIESMVDPELFFRINRKVLIHINAIQKVSSYFNSRLKISSTTLDDEASVVSRDRVNEFKAWLDK
jgi:DNA-binding LytR/AlgR family response regulator